MKSIYYKNYPHPSSEEWVTFVHGAGGSSNVWFKQIRAFKEHFNVLVIDLRGHGRSMEYSQHKENYKMDDVISDMIQVMDLLKLKSSHFIGISLGSILIRMMGISHPHRVKSMVLGGIIMRMNRKARFLLFVGNNLKKIIPYMWLYKMFAVIILPKKNHIKSRKLFIEEAEKLNQKEFLKWFALTAELEEVLKIVREASVSVPTLFIQGSEDYMFLKDLKKYMSEKKDGLLHVIDGCGHVVNVEADAIFNQASIAFIQQNSVN